MYHTVARYLVSKLARPLLGVELRGTHVIHATLEALVPLQICLQRVPFRKITVTHALNGLLSRRRDLYLMCRQDSPIYVGDDWVGRDTRLIRFDTAWVYQNFMSVDYNYGIISLSELAAPDPTAHVKNPPVQEKMARRRDCTQKCCPLYPASERSLTTWQSVCDNSISNVNLDFYLYALEDC